MPLALNFSGDWVPYAARIPISIPDKEVIVAATFRRKETEVPIAEPSELPGEPLAVRVADLVAST